jgi:hypothetical protein
MVCGPKVEVCVAYASTSGHHDMALKACPSYPNISDFGASKMLADLLIVGPWVSQDIDS